MSKSKLYKNKLFIFVVLMPTLLAIIYYGLVASNVYISESSLVVRSADKSTPSMLGQFLQGAGFSTSQNDAYTVKDYTLSRDAMNILNKDMSLKQKFESNKIDPFNRFGGVIYWKNNLEKFYRYYQSMVTATIDPLSTILVLKTKAYTGQDAQQMNQILLKQSEGLVNRLNNRAQKDMIEFAQRELERSEQKAKLAALALGEYRNKYGVINPEQQSAIPLQQIAQLQDQLIATKAQLLQIQTLSSNNPQISSLQQKQKLLEQEIQKETDRVAGPDKHSLASKAIEFQRLTIDSQYADQELVSAMASLQQARTQAQREHIYIERISDPNLPDAATEPKRFQGILAVFLLSLILWGILSILGAGVREHYDH